MKVHVTEATKDVVVTLSERNLRTLQLLWEKALQGEALPSLHRRQAHPGEDGWYLSVFVQPDEIHYKDRPLGPGIGPEDV